VVVVLAELGVASQREDKAVVARDLLQVAAEVRRPQRVVDDRVGRERRGCAGLSRPPSEVGVIAPGDRPAGKAVEVLVEAA
jgi:hypothetical protein